MIIGQPFLNFPLFLNFYYLFAALENPQDHFFLKPTNDNHEIYLFLRWSASQSAIFTILVAE